MQGFHVTRFADEGAKSGAYPLCIRMRAIGNRLLVFAEKNRHILLLHHIFCVAQIAVSIRIKG